MGETKDVRKRVILSSFCHEKGPVQMDKDGQTWLVDKNFSKWLDNTTVHGITHVFKGKSTIKRIFWLIIFMGALVGCTINVLNRFRLLLNNPTSTSVTIDNNNGGVPFPAITICNLNPLSAEAAEEYNVSGLFDHLDSPDVIDELEVDPLLLYTACVHEQNRIPFQLRQRTFRELLNSGHVPLEEFIIGCSYGSLHQNSDPSDEDCRLQFKPVITNYGRCYTFNGDEDNVRMVRVTGQSYGLHLYVNIHQDLYKYSMNSDVGIKVSITPQGSVPQPDEQGIAVGPGSYAYIALKLERTIDNTGRMDRCRKKDQRLVYFPEKKYSQAGCRSDSYIEELLNVCGCIDAIAAEGIDFGYRNCTISDICCLTFTDIAHSSENASCPVECDKLTYTASTSYSRYPSARSAQKLASKYNLTLDYVYDNFIGLSIYFESTTTQVSETTSFYSITAFLSDLGGQLGLFLGASVISMLECGLFCIDEMKALFCTKAMKKRVYKFERWAHIPEVTEEIEKNKEETGSALSLHDEKNITLEEVVTLNENQKAELTEKQTTKK